MILAFWGLVLAFFALSRGARPARVGSTIEVSPSNSASYDRQVH